MWSTLTQDNYERELSLHAAARDALRKAREEIESNTAQRKSAETECENLKNDLATEKKAYLDSKEKLENLVKTSEERINESKKQNKILHNQISSLSQSVQKFQSEKMIAAGAHSNVTIDETDGDSDVGDEISTLKRNVSELREIVRYLKSESDMNESQLDLARRAVEREKSSSEIIKRSLDEARAELDLVRKAADENNKERNSKIKMVQAAAI